jgi:hypothetical protein
MVATIPFVCTESPSGAYPVSLPTTPSLETSTPPIIEACHRTPRLCRSIRPTFPEDDQGDEWPASDLAVEEQYSAVLQSLTLPDTIDIDISPESSYVRGSDLEQPCSELATNSVSLLDNARCYRDASPIVQANAAADVEQGALQADKRAALKSLLQGEFHAERQLGMSPVSAAVEILQRWSVLVKGSNQLAARCAEADLEKKSTFGSLKAVIISPLRLLGEC